VYHWAKIKGQGKGKCEGEGEGEGEVVPVDTVEVYGGYRYISTHP